MKVVTVLFILIHMFLWGESQFSYDSLNEKKQTVNIAPSQKFWYYSNAFLAFVKDRQLTFIDSACKGTERVKAMISKLDKGFSVNYLSNSKKVFLIDSYCRQGEENVNFGLIEIIYNNAEDAKKAFKIFSQKKYFRHYDKILRIYRPVLNQKRLLIFHTATPEDELLRQFFHSVGINDFVLET
ncbi:MAG TPA: hypothetical protein VF008_00395 [Niastella sp.]